MKPPGLFALLLSIATLALCASCDRPSVARQVAAVTVTVPAALAVNIQNADKFLNDLELSPYWKVKKERNGSYLAKARSIAPESRSADTGNEFLFELMAHQSQAFLEKQIIHNKYLPGTDRFSSFSIEVVFGKPTSFGVCSGTPGSNVVLRVFETWETNIGPNSFSSLAVKLSTTNDIFLLLHEQGEDKTRQTTVQKLTAAANELKRLTDLPKDYLVRNVYESFFELLFDKPFKDHDLGRFPGNQDRDTFYGYFKAAPKVSYQGINLKVSHPIYCPIEGTRESSRLQKAEYVGKPHHDGDLLFFLIEDNAVYLPSEFNQQFGTFSGTNRFNGTLEVLNSDGVILLKTNQPFKGWEM